MLTADLVHARRQGGELKLVRVDARAREKLIEIAGAVLAIYARSVGATREEIEAALDDAIARLEPSPSLRRTCDGLRKLAEDAAIWCGPGEGVDPAAVRRAVFVAATAARRALPDHGTFDRAAVLVQASSEIGVPLDRIEDALYADLKNAQRLEAAPNLAPATLVELWEEGQAQAVLLRAVRVTVWVSCASAGAYRALFHRLKFLRLLYEVFPLAGDEPWPEGAKGRARRGGYRVVIDGPFSLFDAVTKYGLKLAMIVPVLRACDAFHLEAEVRWGAARDRLVFRLDGGAAATAPEPRLVDEVAALLASFRALGSDWRVEPSPAILALPGVGVCIPDLTFEHATGARVHLEVLGFWSREAVFKRIELVERGLVERVLFAASKRLRVREDLLDAALPSALYVYKGTMSARTVLERLDAMR